MASNQKSSFIKWLFLALAILFFLLALTLLIHTG